MSPKSKSKPAIQKPQPLLQLDVLQRYSLEETARFLRISEALLYIRIKSGWIKTFKDGARRYCYGAEIARVSAPPADQLSEQTAA